MASSEVIGGSTSSQNRPPPPREFRGEEIGGADLQRKSIQAAQESVGVDTQQYGTTSQGGTRGLPNTQGNETFDDNYGGKIRKSARIASSDSVAASGRPSGQPGLEAGPLGHGNFGNNDDPNYPTRRYSSRHNSNNTYLNNNGPGASIGITTASQNSNNSLRENNIPTTKNVASHEIKWKNGPNAPGMMQEKDYLSIDGPPKRSHSGSVVTKDRVFTDKDSGNTSVRSEVVNDEMDVVEIHNSRYPPSLEGQTTAGLLARWENLPGDFPKKSKLILQHLPAATPEYTRGWDYLKPQTYNTPEGNASLNYCPGPNLRQTRFHTGFQRRHQTDIRQDGSRLQKEQQIQMNRDCRDQSVQEGWKNYKTDYNFNVLSGEGQGRDADFKSLGKRIVNPTHNSDIYTEHDKDMRNRIRNSLHRFSEYPPLQISKNREAQILSEGFLESQKESKVIGHPNPNGGPAGAHGGGRTKMSSQGVSDNYTHLRDNSEEVAPNYRGSGTKTRSQIIFG